MKLFEKNDKWSRLELANACFNVSLDIVKGYFEGFITKEQLLQFMEANCTDEGRTQTKEFFERKLK